METGARVLTGAAHHPGPSCFFLGVRVLQPMAELVCQLCAVHVAQCPVLAHAPSLSACKSASARVERVPGGRQGHDSPGRWVLMGDGTGSGDFWNSVVTHSIGRLLGWGGGAAMGEGE